MEKTLRKVGYCPLTLNSDGSIAYDNEGKIKYFDDTAGGREVATSSEAESAKFYANGICVVNNVNDQGDSIKVELLDGVDDINKDWLGDTIMTDGSIVRKGGIKSMPYFALITANEQYKPVPVTDNDKKKYIVEVWFFCQVSEIPGKTSKTADDGAWDPEFPQYTISAMPRPSDCILKQTLYLDELPTTIPTTTLPESEEI